MNLKDYSLSQQRTRRAHQRLRIHLRSRAQSRLKQQRHDLFMLSGVVAFAVAIAAAIVS